MGTNITDNRTILQKADLALSDLLTGGGLLQPAQAAKFIRLLIDQSVIMPASTVVPMRSPKQLVEKSRFGSRVLRAGAEATALPAGDRVKPDLTKVELDAQLFKAEVRLDNEVLDPSELDSLKDDLQSVLETNQDPSYCPVQPVISRGLLYVNDGRTVRAADRL